MVLHRRAADLVLQMGRYRKFLLLLCHDRSGSNLARSMINEHPDIYLHCRCMNTLFPVVGLYGDLAKDQDWAQLVEDALALLAVKMPPFAVLAGV